MNIAQIEWAKKIQKKIESYDEDLKYFLGSTGDLQNERPKGVEFEVELKTKTKLLWFQNWNKKTVKIDLETELLGREVFTCIEDLIIRKRDKEIAFLNKVEEKDFCRENCYYSGSPACENKICAYCDEFKFKGCALRTIEERQLKY